MKIRLLIVFVGLFLMITPIFAQLEIITNGNVQFNICIGSNATDNEKYAAYEFQKYIEKASNVKIPIVDAQSNNSSNKIVFIENNLMGVEGSFKINTKNKSILNVQGNGRGVVYAVYELLEYWGFRSYASNATLIPTLDRVVLPGDYEKEWTPTFTFRTVRSGPSHSPLYVDWHRLNQDYKGIVQDWGSWSHTSFNLVSPDEYFSTHPEYYSLRNGKRSRYQLCWSNEDIPNIIIQSLGEKMAEKPNAKYWSVSQQDGLGYCTCDKCNAIYDIEKSQSGVILRVVNKVAAAYPDKVISTLAYNFSRSAPKVTKPAENVNIMLCSSNCSRTVPFEQDSAGSVFLNDVKQWCQLTDDVLVWDYTVQFSNYISPYPNFHTLQPNLKVLADNGVKAIFSQGNNATGADFAELRTYIISELLANPNSSTDSLMVDFCNGYYGDGGVYIKQYLDLITNNLLESGNKLAPPKDHNAMQTWLSPQNIDTYMSFFDKAEQAVASDSVKLLRVQFARQPLLYAQLEQARSILWGNKGIFIKSKNSAVERNQKFLDNLDLFYQRCQKEGVDYLNEKGMTPDEYYKTMTDASYLQNENVLSYNCPYVLENSSNGIETLAWKKVALTDGVLGTSEYKYRWIKGFDNEHIVTINLGKASNVDCVSARFMQYVKAGIYFPVEIEVLLSNDNHNFHSVKKVDESVDDRIMKEIKVLDIQLPQNSIAQYVRVKIKNAMADPTTGKSSTAFYVDEIMVR